MTPAAAPTALTPLLHKPTLLHVLGVVGQARAEAFLGQVHADLGSALQTLRATGRSRDQQATQRAAHSLIALAGTFAASELEDAARRLTTALQAGGDAGQDDLVLHVGNLTARLISELDDWRLSAANAPESSGQ